MRKVLSFVLVLAMILGSVSMAFAASFTDTKGADYEEAAAVLNELGVISGYADGTFGGEKNITRAEFATMIVNALGFTTTGAAATGFKDVPNDYWAAQAILTAKNLEIVSGYSDGTFQPKKNITNDEAIAMLVRALGYKAEYLMGTYPASYVNQAMTLGILKDVATGSAASTRGNVAQLIYNALDCYMVSYNYFGQVQTIDAAKLFTRLGYRYSYTGFWDGLDQNNGLYGDIYSKNGSSKQFFIPQSEFITGKYVSAKNYIDVDGAKTYVGVMTSGAAFENSVYVVGSSNIVKDTADTTYAISKEADKYGYYTLYSSVVWTGTDMKAPENVQKNIKDAKLGNATFTTVAAGTPKEDTFLLNGVNDLTDIKENDVVTYYTANRGNGTKIVRVDVSTQTVAGTMTKLGSDGKVYIDGVAYTISGNAGKDVTNLELGAKGTAYLNYAGKVSFFKLNESAASYAVILGYKAASTDGKGTLEATQKGVVELLLADGTAKQFDYKGFAFTTGDIDKVITYKTTDDVVTTFAAVSTTDAIVDKVLKNGTVDGRYFADACVTFVNGKFGATEAVKADTTNRGWSVVATADLLDKEYTNGIAYKAQKDTDRLELVVINGSSSATTTTYYVYTGKWTEIYDKSGNYYEINVLVDGEAKTVDAVGTFNTATTAGAICTATFSNGKIATLTEASLPTDSGKCIDYKADALSVNIGTTTTPKWVSLDKDVVVYVKNAKGVYEVGDTSDIVVDKNLVFFDTTKDGGDKVYDIVLVNPAN